MRRSMSVLTSFVLAAGLIVGLGPRVGAATCSVANARTGTRYAILQEAVDASADGDTLGIEGVCVGTTRVEETRLFLVGTPTAGSPNPTLDGGHAAPVLSLDHAKVVISNVTIENGLDSPYLAEDSYGIRVYHSRLTLKGNALVVGNHSGGVGVAHGRVTLRENVVIEGNAGSGIGGWKARITLNDSSSITDNTSIAREQGLVATGGGIWVSEGRATLNDSSSVTGNRAEEGGGIAVGGDAILTLNDSAAVTGNTALDWGGGIAPVWSGAVIYVCSDQVVISPNDPDDPPETQPCPS